MKKIIVASDLHGSGFYTKKLMAAAAREKAGTNASVGGPAIPWGPQ